MAIARVQVVGEDLGGAGTGHVIAFGSNNTAGNTIIVCGRAGGAGTFSVTDTRSNTYTERIHRDQLDDGSVLFCFTATNVAAGANTVSISYGGASVTSRSAIMEYSGLNTSSLFDKQTSNQSGSGTSTTPTISSAQTPTQAESLCLAIVTLGGIGGGTITAGASYTLLDVNSAASRLGVEERILAASSSQAPSFSVSVADSYNIGLLILNGASGGGGASQAPRSSAFMRMLMNN